MTTGDSADVPASHRRTRDARQRFTDGRIAFRAWRRSRPFWGGFLLAIAGLELLSLPLSGVLLHGALKLVIYIGIGGVFGVLIGILLIAAGIMCWVAPTQRIFYGIAGIVLGVLSFPASNLGGFFLGMLLAIVGGSMAFAWTRIEPQPVDEAPAPPTEPSAGIELVTGTTETPEATEDAEPVQAPESDEKRLRGSAEHSALAVATMPALLVAGLLAFPGHAAHTTARDLCILGICIGSSPSPTATPTPTAGTSSSAGASSSADPQPGTSASASSGSGSGSGPGASPSGKASGTASPSPTSTKVKHASASAGLVVSTSTSVLAAGSSTMNNFIFDGIVNMPVAGGGTVQMLKFSASSADLSGGVSVTITERGETTVDKNTSLTSTGGLTLYATKLTATILGIGPLTFTPTTIDAILLKVTSLVTGLVPITMTNVSVDHFLIVAGDQQWNNTSLGF